MFRFAATLVGDRQLIVQLDRVIEIRDRAIQIAFRFLDRAATVECICVLRLKLDRAIEIGNRAIRIMPNVFRDRAIT